MSTTTKTHEATTGTKCSATIRVHYEFALQESPGKQDWEAISSSIRRVTSLRGTESSAHTARPPTNSGALTPTRHTNVPLSSTNCAFRTPSSFRLNGILVQLLLLLQQSTRPRCPRSAGTLRQSYPDLGLPPSWRALLVLPTPTDSPAALGSACTLCITGVVDTAAVTAAAMLRSSPAWTSACPCCKPNSAPLRFSTSIPRAAVSPPKCAGSAHHRPADPTAN